MVEAVPSPLSFWYQLTNLGHGIVFKGKLVTVLLGLVGCCVLLMHYAIGVVPALWLAGLDVDARYAGELRPAYSREQRHQHRQLHKEVGEFFAKYDLLCTVIPTEEARQLWPTVGYSSLELLQPTAPAMARMMCCPAVALALYDTSAASLVAKQSTKVKGGKKNEGEDDGSHAHAAGQELALMLIGRPFGEDALLAAAAAWADAHPPPADAGCQQHPSATAQSVQNERTDGETESTDAANACPEKCVGFGARLVASVVCSPGWGGVYQKLQWVVHLATQRVAAAYNGQRLHGSN